jgi:RNA polymerase sigma factor (sigma-70 family)
MTNIAGLRREFAQILPGPSETANFMEFYKESDAKTWYRFKQGDEDAFSAIYSGYSKKLYWYGLKFTHNHSLIEDSLQDLFFELIKNRKNIGDTDNIFRYLLTSFRRKLFRKLKMESRYDLSNDKYDYSFDVMYSVEHDMVLEDNTNQRNLLFMRALQQLTPRQKEAIYLKFTNGLDYEEIAGIMEMSLEACRNLIYRAVKMLREIIRGEK